MNNNKRNETALTFGDRERILVTTYIHSRVGQIPEAVAALLASYDRLRDKERQADLARANPHGNWERT